MKSCYKNLSEPLSTRKVIASVGLLVVIIEATKFLVTKKEARLA